MNCGCGNLAGQFNMRLEERASERSRIARDLHDTLLQSFQGLLLRFQAGINMLAQRPAEAREVLEDAVDRASQAIAEGRDAIGALRMSTVEKNDLAVAIKTVAEELARGPDNQASTPFQVLVEGAPRNLHPILRDEVYRLVTEALRNSFRRWRRKWKWKSATTKSICGFGFAMMVRGLILRLFAEMDVKATMACMA